MTEILRTIESLPPEERLPYAIEIIRALTCDDTYRIGYYQQKFGIGPGPARVLDFLLRRSPHVASTKQLHTVVSTLHSETDPKIVTVYVCRLRREGININTHRYLGYSIPREQAEAIPLPETQYELPPIFGASVNLFRVWTPDEDKRLIALVSAGTPNHLIAYKLGRTERGVTERIQKLRRQGDL